MSRRILGLLPLLAACTQTYLSPLQPVVTASPSLLDVGELVLGDEVQGTIRLAVRDGAAQVLDVTVLPTQGDGFAWSGTAPFAIDADDQDELTITFHPTEAGYASALVKIATDTREGDVEVEVRGRAIEPDLVAAPFVIDLGVVAVGERVTTPLRLENHGTADVVVDGAHTLDAAVTVEASWPVAIAAGTSVDVEVACAPTGPGVLVTGITFDLGTHRTPDLALVRANDCGNGLPASYDLDGDGTTSCGGDCDDLDGARHPGAAELPDDVDQDCDGLVDEGTARGDDDGDGWCEDDVSCAGGKLPGDCSDDDASVSPEGLELVDNGVDDDCDGRVDLGSTDVDGDGFGPRGGDCDDLNPVRRPGAREAVNGVDDDCDGLVDEGTLVVDDDGDGWCEASFCVDGAEPDDCDDGDPAVNPLAVEVADFRDDDCDRDVDEGTERGDDDGDGFTEIGGDCDDADPDVNPMRGSCP